MQVTSAESTELFVGQSDAPLQLVRVGYTDAVGTQALSIVGEGLTSDIVEVRPGDGSVEVPVRVTAPVAGQQRAARVLVGDVEHPFVFTVGEPGWTMFMISHFHYDPVWWNTQGAYTSQWTEEPPGRARQNNGFALVTAHLEMARRDPDYKFVLAEIDYLKPYFDTHPEDRAELRRLIIEERVEVMGGTYNEPNTNLVGAETAIRNFVHGIGYQRDVLGADPATAWQLDVFGHDPQFPGMAADAGLTSSSWARGPHHQWGPMADEGDPTRMQFRSEFEWIAPSGLGLLTHYMPAHYSAGWWMDSAASLADAEQATYELFASLKSVALTRNVLLPVGTDYTPPNTWVTQIHRDWNARYTWPRFICALPSEFFAAVRAEATERGLVPSPQTRDMNPVYTGKDVSYIDTKQANRAAEDAVLGAERFAVFAALLSGARYPEAALAKAWVQLAYGAHHDAITGSESDQVYLDLLTGWRDAWEIGSATRTASLELMSQAVAPAPGCVVVWNPLGHKRTDVVTVRLDEPVDSGVSVLDSTGVAGPALVGDDGHSVSWLATDVDSLGWRSYRLTASPDDTGWQPVEGLEIANDHHRLRVDPARGGAVVSLAELSSGQELIAEGRVGNEIAVYEEYPAHPQAGEGPWHLLPAGPVLCSSAAEADSVQALRCPLGERLVVCGRIDELLRYTQVLTLWHGVDRVDLSTTIDEFTGADRLVRLRWPCPVPGALPVSEVGDAVIGRGFGLLHDPDDRAGCAVDSAKHPWTLDNPAHGWFGLSSAARIKVGADLRAVSVAEVVGPDGGAAGARDLMIALVRAGVTATCTAGGGPRYGHLDVDSNLPDTRIALGGPDENPFTAEVLAAADHAYTAELHRQLAATGQARVWVPAAEPLAGVWRPGADLRGARALPVLIVAGHWAGGLALAVAAVVDDLDDAQIEVTQNAPAGISDFESRTVALLNRGVPGFAVDPDQTLHASLMRSCTGWPSGVWIDPPQRKAPDGSNFELQHWTHTFEFALVAGQGDWRESRIASRSAEFSHPMVCVVASDGVGVLPADGSLLSVEPAGAVHLAALKAGGNPTATGSSATVAPEDVTIRLVENHGGAAEVAISSGVGAVSAVVAADLLEAVRPDGDPPLRIHGYQIATLLARLDLHAVLDADGSALAPDSEAAQPLYARYWLHNRGPAPLGGLPAVAHLHPETATATPGETIRLRLTVASDCSDATLSGTVRLRGPRGWTVDPDELPFELATRHHREAEIVVTAPAVAAPGDYPVRAQLTLAGDVPPAWRQTVEDICVVSVGPAGELVRLVTEPSDVVVDAGQRARLTVEIANDAYADLALEAHLISPWGTWDWLGPAVRGAVLRSRSTVAVTFDVAPPPWVTPGRWWALIRIGCAGRLLYTPAVAVTVR
ncbi:glycoside hydrolase family 38 N-terminal domain-containing protein [Mycolicibacterium sp. CBM1]